MRFKSSICDHAFPVTSAVRQTLEAHTRAGVYKRHCKYTVQCLKWKICKVNVKIDWFPSKI